jgi:SAM-dependent methyltransferase
MTDISSNQAWFDTWFDSPYYHTLYKHRDYEEAQFFINNLADYFQFKADDQIMDLACGKGRHSIYLNKLGYQVTGLDLSEQNITHAKQFANNRLHFAVHDMRETYSQRQFNYILNLFTSFGYFDTEAENQQAICAAAKALKPRGQLLIDFLNPYKVVHHLVAEEVKTIDGIEFHITRDYQEGFIAKDIRFEDKGKNYHFQERVRAISFEQFQQYFTTAGLELLDTFGNYKLEPFNQQQSDRMIFVLGNKPEASRC